MPKSQSNWRPLWPVKTVEGQYYILDLEAFEFPDFCIILEREGREPQILPVKTLEEAELWMLSESSYYRALERDNYKIYESAKTPFRLLSKENQEAIRQGLNFYQVGQMKRQPIQYLSYSGLSPLQASAQNDYLCFPYGEQRQVRANFHVQGPDLKKALLQISGFEEIITEFLSSYRLTNSLFPSKSPTYSEWIPVETSWSVQIRLI